MAAENQTEKSRFYSKYSLGFVTAAQYITELICVNKADGRDLPEKFWKNEEWANHYKQQIFSANTLLKTYSVHVILAALRDWRAKKIYSFRSPMFKKLLDEFKYKMDKVQKFEIAIDDSNENLPETRPDFQPKKGNIISKLRDLDG